MSDYIDSTLHSALNGDFWFPFAVSFWLPFAASCGETVSMVSAASCPLGILFQNSFGRINYLLHV